MVGMVVGWYVVWFWECRVRKFFRFEIIRKIFLGVGIFGLSFEKWVGCEEGGKYVLDVVRKKFRCRLKDCGG